MKKRKGTLCREMAVILAVLMLCNTLDLPVLTAYAENVADTTGLCEHHTEHTPECGYVEAVEGSPCLHEHDENCSYIGAVEEVLCDCIETDENGAIIHSEDCGYTAPVEGSPCLHEHDESCSYIAAVEGSACTYECSEETVDNGEDIQNKDTEEPDDVEEPKITETEITEDEEELIENDTEEIFATPSNAEKIKEVKAMLDALPEISELEGMSDEELSKVHDKAQEAYEVYKSLTEEEQAEFSGVVEKLSSIMEWMNINFIQLVDTDIDNEETLFVQISWNEMEFTYTDGGWNPEVHNYIEGGWTTSDDAGVITVANRGYLPVVVSFAYIGTKSGISGKFTYDSITLKEDELGITTFKLEGKPSEKMDKAELGSITITVKRAE